MNPKAINNAVSNPGLPGFERFWGYQYWLSASLAYFRRMEAPRVIEESLSYRKVFAIGSCAPIAVGPSPTFLQESSSDGPTEQSLKEQFARREEGSSMPAIQ
jgi:hypothetical protein